MRGEQNEYLKRFWRGIASVEDIISPEMEYRPLTKAIGDRREYFENQLPEKDRLRFKEWNKL